MWQRKELKKQAKKVLHKNYWTAIVVCFLIALLTGEFGTSIVGMWNTKDSLDPNFIINYKNNNQENHEIEEKQDKKNEIFSKEDIKQKLNETERKILETVEINLNSAIKSQKYFFKIGDAIKLFNINKIELGVFLCIGTSISIYYIYSRSFNCRWKKVFFKGKKRLKY